MKIGISIAFIAVVFSVSAIPASAVTTRVDLLGQVADINGLATGGGGLFAAGQSVSYSFTFDETALAGGGVSGAAATTNAIVEFSGAVGSYGFLGTTGRVFTRNDGVVPSIFGGAPYDQISVTNSSLISNQTFLGLNREDFSGTGGLVTGFPLLSVGFNVQTTDTALLANNNVTGQTFSNLAAPAYLPLARFQMLFGNSPVGSIPIAVNARFTSLTVSSVTPVPEPTTYGLLLAGLAVIGFAKTISRRALSR